MFYTVWWRMRNTIISIFLEPNQIYKKNFTSALCDTWIRWSWCRQAELPQFVQGGRERVRALPTHGNIFFLPREIYLTYQRKYIFPYWRVYISTYRGGYICCPGWKNQTQGLFQIQSMRINVANKAVYYCRAVVGSSFRERTAAEICISWGPKEQGNTFMSKCQKL